MNIKAVLPEPIKRVGRHVLRPGGIRAQRYVHYPPAIMKAWRAVLADDLTYTTEPQVANLLDLVRDFEHRGEQGAIIETGCALGGSAILMCAAKSPEREMRVYDVFGMIPPPTDHDGADMQRRYQEIASQQATGLGGKTYYAYETDLQATVAANFARLGYPIDANHVELIAGKVQDTLVVDGPVCLAHIDVDWYEPVMASLERIVPNLTPHGAVVLRAYSSWSGCRKATDDYFDAHGRTTYRQTWVDGALMFRKLG